MVTQVGSSPAQLPNPKPYSVVTYQVTPNSPRQPSGPQHHPAIASGRVRVRPCACGVAPFAILAPPRPTATPQPQHGDADTPRRPGPGSATALPPSPFLHRAASPPQPPGASHARAHGQ